MNDRCADVLQTPTYGVYCPYHMQIPPSTCRCTGNMGAYRQVRGVDMGASKCMGTSEHTGAIQMYGAPIPYHMQIPPRTYRCTGEHGDTQGGLNIWGCLYVHEAYKCMRHTNIWGVYGCPLSVEHACL